MASVGTLRASAPVNLGVRPPITKAKRELHDLCANGLPGRVLGLP
jgi:hypothetical protein